MNSDFQITYPVQQGLSNARATGKAYREAYVKNSKFIDGRFNPKEVHNNTFTMIQPLDFATLRKQYFKVIFKASEVSRVLMSAGAYSSGLFEHEDSGLFK